MKNDYALQVRLPTALANKWKGAAKREGRSLSSYIRFALHSYMCSTAKVPVRGPKGTTPTPAKPTAGDSGRSRAKGNR